MLRFRLTRKLQIRPGSIVDYLVYRRNESFSVKLRTFLATYQYVRTTYVGYIYSISDPHWFTPGLGSNNGVKRVTNVSPIHHHAYKVLIQNIRTYNQCHQSSAAGSGERKIHLGYLESLLFFFVLLFFYFYIVLFQRFERGKKPIKT